MNCPKCKTQGVKNGIVGRNQRYKCKKCGYQYTKKEVWGKSLEVKFLALYLYLSGMSLRSIAKLLKISATAVLKWIKEFSNKFEYESPKTHIKAVEIDEMWHFVEKKKKSTGHLRLLIELTENYSLLNVAIEQSKP